MRTSIEIMFKLGIFVVLLVCCFVVSVESIEAREVLRARLAMKRNSLKVLDAKVDANDAKVDANGDGVGVPDFISNDKLNSHSSPSDAHQMAMIEEQASHESISSVKQHEEADAPISIIDLIGEVAEVEVQSSKTKTKSSSESTEKEKEQTDPELLEQAAAEGQVDGCSPIPQLCTDGSPVTDQKILPPPSLGCGPSLPNNIVVDSLKRGSLSSKFSGCCANHYYCYSQFRASKDNCDHAFYMCMLDKCIGWWCKTKVYGYYLAVSENGCQVFESCQKQYGCKS